MSRKMYSTLTLRKCLSQGQELSSTVLPLPLLHLSIIIFVPRRTEAEADVELHGGDEAHFWKA